MPESAGFRDRLTGRYRLANGEELIVTRSEVRLFVRESTSGEWRGLHRQSGRVWSGGARVLPDEALTEYRFQPPRDGQSPAVEIQPREGHPQVAVRADRYRVEATTFRSHDGTRLAGTFYIPSDLDAPAPAAVLVHGSGPQDRHGFASIMHVLADALAAAGIWVLAYDKRGVGGSEGTWSRASFQVLGRDAAAALDHVRAQGGVDPARGLFAGTSQAGWVVAKAIEQGAAPAGVYLLGAAGSALTVEEQNLYNTGVRLRCDGADKAEIDLALAQQRAFYATLRDGTWADELERLTATARRQPQLVDWLFPTVDEIDPDAGHWFTTLELDFDPLPIWRDYPGHTCFVFAEHDDATPTTRVMERLRPLAAAAPLRRTLHLLDGAQHLALIAVGLCTADLTDVHRFHPGLFSTLSTFAACFTGRA